MKKEFYTCEYCFKEFVPKRRRIQKFCSDSCRVKSHHAKNKVKKLTEPEIIQNDKPTINKVEQISPAGVGNAALGTLIVEALKFLSTSSENKKATKGDIEKLLSSLKRYHKVENLPLNEQGKTPYFDLQTNEIIYSLWPLNG
jgi:hypothetical protein